MGRRSRRNKGSSKRHHQSNKKRSTTTTTLQSGTNGATEAFSENETNHSDKNNVSHLFWPASAITTNNNININGEEVDDPTEEEEEEDEEDFSAILDSIVKIHCTHSMPDFLIPWQKQHQSTSTSSGFVIAMPVLEDKNNGDDDKSTANINKNDKLQLRIMTNAHSVEYASMVQVQKRGQEHKYEAIVEHIANEADLAILKIVHNDELDLELDEEHEFFFSGQDGEEDHPYPKPLEFGALPELQQEVDVLGYPTGGDSLSITSGVVSRIEMQEYTQASTHLLAMQVDAAINPGNSGGPVVNDDNQVIGVAFQGLDEAQNIGYVVPVTVVQHVLYDIQRHGRYTGFCSLGTDLVYLENKAFRKSLGMLMPKSKDAIDGPTTTTNNNKPQNLSGVMVKSVAPTASSNGILLPNDVILEIDGIPMANDGKIPFRPGERVAAACYLQTKFMNDVVKMKLLREDQIVDNVACPIHPVKRLVPAHYHDQPPPYLIVAGMVFTALSIPYLEASGAWDDYQNDYMSYLLGLTEEPLKNESDQIVIMSQVLAHRENMGYDKLGELRLQKVNGQKVESLAHLKSLIDDAESNGNAKDEYLRLEFLPRNRIIVLERSKVSQATMEVCKEQSIQNSFYLGTADP